MKQRLKEKSEAETKKEKKTEKHLKLDPSFFIVRAGTGCPKSVLNCSLTVIKRCQSIMIKFTVSYKFLKDFLNEQFFENLRV